MSPTARAQREALGNPQGLWASQVTQVRHPHCRAPLLWRRVGGGGTGWQRASAQQTPVQQPPRLFRFQEPGSAHSGCQGVGIALREAQVSSSASWRPDTRRQPGLPASAAPEPREGPTALGPREVPR